MRAVLAVAFLLLIFPQVAWCDESAILAELASRKLGRVFPEKLRPGESVTSLTLIGPPFGPAELKLATGFGGLEYLGLVGCSLKDDDLTVLAQFGKLSHVRIARDMKVGPKGMAHVARLPMLKRVDLDFVEITPALLRPLAGAKGLNQLLFDFAPVSDESLAEVGRVTGLTYLSMRGKKNPLTDAGLEPLARLTKLTHLDLQQSDVAGPGLKHVGGLKDLYYLGLDGSRIDDAGLVHLAKLTALREVSLTESRVTGQGLGALSATKRLHKLNLKDSPVDDAGAAVIAKLPEVGDLDLSGTKVTDASLGHLGRLRGLMSLGLVGSKVTAAGVEAFRKAHPNVKVWFDPLKD